MRLLELVFYLLKSHSKVTIKELSETFEVSTKTIQRDIDKLCVLGIPIMTYRGKNGGVEIDKNYIIAKQVLKQDDYESLITALYLGEGFSEKIKSASLIDKYRLMEPNRCTHILNDLKMSFIIDLDDNPIDKKSETYQQIDLAMKSKAFVSLELRDQTLEVVPISYVLSSEGFLLYCYHHTYELIPFSNIQDARCLSKTYEQQLMPYEEYKAKRE